MKHLKSRTTALFLTLVMCLNLLPMTALAASSFASGFILNSVVDSRFNSHQEMSSGSEQEHNISSISYNITFVYDCPNGFSMKQTEHVSYSACSCCQVSTYYTLNKPLFGHGI